MRSVAGISGLQAEEDVNGQRRIPEPLTDLVRMLLKKGKEGKSWKSG